MTRILVPILMLALVGTGSPSNSVSPSQDTVPELVVSLAPAEGVVPLDAADQAVPYRFLVIALNRETRIQYGSADVLVRLGQKRALKGSQLRGSVDLREDGSASYSAELAVDGKVLRSE